MKVKLGKTEIDLSEYELEVKVRTRSGHLTELVNIVNTFEVIINDSSALQIVPVSSELYFRTNSDNSKLGTYLVNFQMIPPD